MILFNREVLFVHNPKTAGTSVLAFLSAALPDARKVGVVELGSHHPSLELALGYACAQTGNRPQDFKRILVGLRDPVSREKSMYAYFRSISAFPQIELEINDAEILRIVRKSTELDCNSYMQWLWNERGSCDIWNSRRYYSTAAGARPDNIAVLRFSHIQTDIRWALNGLRKNPLLAEPLPHLNATDTANVGFNDNSRTIIARSYAWMVEEGLLPVDEASSSEFPREVVSSGREHETLPLERSIAR